jgi:hypothetical protein
MDDNMPHGYSFLDDDLSAEPKEKEFDHHENENVVLPRTHEEVLQNLQHNKIDQNFLEREAHAKGIDFDDKNAQKEPEGYPDSFKSEEEEKTSE